MSQPPNAVLNGPSPENNVPFKDAQATQETTKTHQNGDGSIQQLPGYNSGAPRPPLARLDSRSSISVRPGFPTQPGVVLRPQQVRQPLPGQQQFIQRQPGSAPRPPGQPQFIQNQTRPGLNPNFRPSTPFPRQQTPQGPRQPGIFQQQRSVPAFNQPRLQQEEQYLKALDSLDSFNKSQDNVGYGQEEISRSPVGKNRFFTEGEEVVRRRSGSIEDKRGSTESLDKKSTEGDYPSRPESRASSRMNKIMENEDGRGKIDISNKSPSPITPQTPVTDNSQKSVEFKLPTEEVKIKSPSPIINKYQEKYDMKDDTMSKQKDEKSFKEIQNEKTQEKINERTYDKVHDRVQDKGYDKIQDKVYDKAYDKIQDKVYDKTYDKIYEKTQDRGHDKVYDKMHDKVQEKAHEKTREKIIHNKTPEKTHEKIIERKLEPKHLDLKHLKKRSPSRQEGDNDSGVDESTQGNDISNGDQSSPRKSSGKNLSRTSSTTPTKARSLSRGSKSPSLKSPDSTASTPGTADKKKVPMNKIQVGSAPSPNLKVVRSKIGSLENASYKPGGGHVKIESKKLDFKNASSRIEAKNDRYTPKGGDKKIQQQKLQWNAKSKVGSLENATHKPKGGDKKIETVKLDFKDKAKPKVGSKDNIKHVPGGGDVKFDDEVEEDIYEEIENKKLDLKAQSKVGSLDNVKHRPGGGEKKIFDDKDYLKQRSAISSENHSLSGSQNSLPSQPEAGGPVADENLNQER